MWARRTNLTCTEPVSVWQMSILNKQTALSWLAWFTSRRSSACSHFPWSSPERDVYSLTCGPVTSLPENLIVILIGWLFHSCIISVRNLLWFHTEFFMLFQTFTSSLFGIANAQMKEPFFTTIHSFNLSTDFYTISINMQARTYDIRLCTFHAIHNTLPYLSPAEANTVCVKNEMQNSALFSPFLELRELRVRLARERATCLQLFGSLLESEECPWNCLRLSYRASEVFTIV